MFKKAARYLNDNHLKVEHNEKTITWTEVINVNSYENMQAYKSLQQVISKLDIQFVTSTLKRSLYDCYSKCWAENPIKNQMMILNMIDWCHCNNINKICMDGSWEFSIDEVTAGIDVADAPENYTELMKGLNKLIDNFEFIKTPHLPKIEKIKDRKSVV